MFLLTILFILFAIGLASAWGEPEPEPKDPREASGTCSGCPHIDSCRQWGKQ